MELFTIYERKGRQADRTWKENTKTTYYINFEDDPALDELSEGRFDRDKFMEKLSSFHQELSKLLSEIHEISPIPETFHKELLDLLKLYYFVGG